MITKSLRPGFMGLFLCLLVLMTAPAFAELKETYTRWQWFKDAYWIVPEEGIYSVLHTLGNSFGVVRGQTVFHITDYFNGYFTDTGEVRNEPVGHMERVGKRKKGGNGRSNWAMVNQMTSPAMSGTLSHWAYMILSEPGMASYDSLPFVDESIPQFMSACPEGPLIWRG